MDFASFSAKILKNVLQIKRLKWVDLHPTCVSNTGTPASKGELGTVGHIPVVGEDVGVFYVGNLREIFAATANLEGVFPIHLEVALRLAVFHGMRLREAAYGKGLAQGADVHLRGSQRIENVGILQINLVGLGEFAYLLFVGIQQAQHFGIAQILEVFHHRVAANLKGSGYPVGIQHEGHFAANQGDERLMLEHDDWSVEAVADKCGISRQHFYKVFQVQTGTTPAKFHQEH